MSFRSLIEHGYAPLHVHGRLVGGCARGSDLLLLAAGVRAWYYAEPRVGWMLQPGDRP